MNHFLLLQISLLNTRLLKQVNLELEFLCSFYIGTEIASFFLLEKMGDDESGEMGFQYCNERSLSCPSSGMNTTPVVPEKVSGIAMGSVDMVNSSYVDSLYGSGWVPVASLNQSERLGTTSVLISHGEFADSYPSLLGNLGNNSVSHAVDPNLGEMGLKLPDFRGGNIYELVNSFDQAGTGCISNTICPAASYTLDNEKVPAGEDCIISEEPAAGASPNGKRRRASNPSSPLKTIKNAQGDSHTDVARNNTSVPKELSEKKQKIENTAGSKQTSKQPKESSQGRDAPKADCVHMRAKRGQATNSHSLAERVRREKISERMRLLQELVPGCTKITGKAVMLDEIINYVQSLQQQVEFLSMKLATVNPELNINIERILSKDVHCSHGGAASIPSLNLGISPSNPYSQGFVLRSPSGIPNTTPHYHPVPQALCDNQLQNLFHMGFGTSLTTGDPALNGISRVEM
ncbi:hypothetical protein Dimus_004494 [Dionaea muscipula]